MNRSLVCFALALHVTGCVWATDLPTDATSIHVVPGRELVVVDDAIVSGPLASNRTDGPLSFRHAMEGLALGDGASLRWLQAWSRRLREDGPADRAVAFDTRVTCRWLHALPENACDAACGSCAAQTLRLEDAPFRLIAITNRTDLSVMPDSAADGGEGRLVFALTDGPADDATSAPLPMTVIFEYAQEGAPFDWTTRWHALGQASDAEFPTKLAALTETFVAKGSLAQLRTADRFTGSMMILHQFARASGELTASNVRNSPDYTRVPEAEMTEFASDNAAAINDGSYVLPKAWWAIASSTSDQPPAYVTALPQHDALVLGTCAGCHAKAERGFQIDPMAKGDARLSTFLVDPTKDLDEVRRRVEWMQLTLWRGH